MTGRLVGVLGGMGPEATILLQQRRLAFVVAKDDSDHLPLLIDMNPQVLSRIAHLIERTGADPAPILVGMAQRLQAAGATALAMPCLLAALNSHSSRMLCLAGSWLSIPLTFCLPQSNSKY